MDIIFEIIGEFFFEVIIEIIKNKKINIILRCTLLFIICLFYLAIIVGLSIVAYDIYKSNITIFIILLILIFLLLFIFIKFLKKLIIEIK